MIHQSSCRLLTKLGKLTLTVGCARRFVIFVKSVQRARELNKLLVECNFPSIAIHGSMTQTERLEVCHGVSS